MHFIGRYDKLHAICILLKPNQARITPSFEYCITEILRNLHESASNNVVFIITNAKSTNFKPGNTISTLRDFLRRKSLERIKLTKDTIYCIENDTVQHVVEHINGCPHDDDADVTASMSWEKSVKTTTDMLAYIQKLHPRYVDGTQCIYNTRRLIDILSNVLFDVVMCSVDNMETIEEKRKEISNRRLEIQNSPEDFVPEDIQNVLYTEIQRIEIKKELKHINTICKSPKCSLVVGNKRHFKIICCDHCRGFITLWTCRAFEGITEAKCKRCGCERAIHQWQATKTELKKEVLFDRSEEGIEKVLNRDDALRELSAYCEKLEKSTSQIANEQKQMLETGANLSFFLKQNVLLSGTASDNLGACLRNEYEAFEYATSEIRQEKMRQINNADEKEVCRIVKEVNKDMRVAIQHKENLLKLIQKYDECYKKANDPGKDYTTQEVRKNE